MNRDKSTFTDPQTGEKMESTWLARWGSASVFGLVAVPLGGVIGMFAAGSVAGLIVGPPLGFPYGLDKGLLSGLAVGLAVSLLLVLPSVLQAPEMEDVRSYNANRRIHDAIARRQYYRRLKRKLLEKEGAHVPAGALSRAQPPREPEPTDAALSVADRDDKPRRITGNEDTLRTAKENI